VCLSILKDKPGGWAAAITVKQILVGIQVCVNRASLLSGSGCQHAVSAMGRWSSKGSPGGL
jgi:ubiquitin-protein ligase